MAEWEDERSISPEEAPESFVECEYAYAGCVPGIPTTSAAKEQHIKIAKDRIPTQQWKGPRFNGANATTIGVHTTTTFERTPDCKPLRKRARLTPVKKWQPDEEKILINFLKEHENFEKPTAQGYYRLFCEETNFNGEWTMARDKVRNMREQYKKAKTWLDSTGGGTTDGSSRESFVQRLCPHFFDLEEISFGSKTKAPIQSAILEISDCNDDDEGLIQYCPDDTDLDNSCIGGSGNLRYVTVIPPANNNTVHTNINHSKGINTKSSTYNNGGINNSNIPSNSGYSTTPIEHVNNTNNNTGNENADSNTNSSREINNTSPTNNSDNHTGNTINNSTNRNTLRPTRGIYSRTALSELLSLQTARTKFEKVQFEFEKQKFEREIALKEREVVVTENREGTKLEKLKFEFEKEKFEREIALQEREVALKENHEAYKIAQLQSEEKIRLEDIKSKERIALMELRLKYGGNPP